MRRGLRFVAALGMVAVALTFAAACRTATQITVDIRTNVACTDPTQWQGIAVYTGSPGLDVETKDPTLTSKACDKSGDVGSLVLVPDASKDATVAVRVVAGLTRPPDQCAAASYEGCIVARRTISFIPHEGLRFTIDLTSDCVGQGCDVLRTCVNGQCADARLTSTPSSDAAVSTTSGARVQCGPNLTCPANDPTQACCLTFADDKVTNAICAPTTSCPPTSATLLCDKSSDCAGTLDDAGVPFSCVAEQSYTDQGDRIPGITNSECLPQPPAGSGEGIHIVLCDDKLPCRARAGESEECDPTALNDLPGYFACEF